jgi:hypothetical protein
MSPFLQHITSLWILYFSVYPEMERACHVREYSDGCSPFMLECKFLTKRWFVGTPTYFLNTHSSFNVFAPLPTLSSNVLQNHFRLVSGCCFHSTLHYVSPEAFELATSCSVNKASTSSSPFFWIKTKPWSVADW